MKALVIDDSRTIRAIIGGIFSQIGFTVVEADNGRSALERLSLESDFDVLLVDWNMPIMDGLEFVKQARRRPELATTPILMVTTETEMDRVVAALDAGVNEYLMKPFTRDALTDKLAMIGVVGFE
jgi:two-component system chemotaxis response regulator CheY